MDLLERESYPGAFCGFRAFRWHEGKLCSLAAVKQPGGASPKSFFSHMAQPYAWDLSGGVETAACKAQYFVDPSEGHASPVADCSCGLWAYKTLEDLLAEPLLYQGYGRDMGFSCAPVVVALCAAWGRIVLHERGMRAEFMRPVAFLEIPLKPIKVRDLTAHARYFRLASGWHGYDAPVEERRAFPVPDDLKPVATEHGIRVGGDERGLHDVDAVAIALAEDEGLTLLQKETPRTYRQFLDRETGRITFGCVDTLIGDNSRGTMLPLVDDQPNVFSAAYELRPFEVKHLLPDDEGVTARGHVVWVPEGFPGAGEAHEDLARDIFRMLDHLGASDFEDRRESIRCLEYGHARYRWGMFDGESVARLERCLGFCVSRTAATKLAVRGETREALDARVRGEYGRARKATARADKLLDELAALGRTRENLERSLAAEREREERTKKELEHYRQNRDLNLVRRHVWGEADSTSHHLDPRHMPHVFVPPTHPNAGIRLTGFDRLAESLGEMGRKASRILNSLNVEPSTSTIRDTPTNSCCGESHDVEGSSFWCRRVFGPVIRGARRTWGRCVRLVTEGPGKISRLAFSWALPDNDDPQENGEVRREG